MRKKLFSIMTLCIIVFLLFGMTMSAYATTDEESDTMDYYIHINVQTNEITEISKEEVETNAEAAKMEDNGFLVDEYITSESIPINSTSMLNPGISPNSIIGSDNRFNNGVDPHICEILSQFNNNGVVRTKRGTGFVIYKNIILTAGHMVYDPDLGGVATTIAVSPGATGNNTAPEFGPRSTPYGTYGNVTGIIVDPNFYYNNAQADDYALVTYGSDLGVGWMSIACWEDWSQLQGNIVSLQGYDKNRLPWVQWYGSGSVVQVNNSNFAHNIDSQVGTSGSPIWVTPRIAIGIHTTGITNSIFGGYNLATNITRSRFNLFYQYITQSPFYTNDA